MHATAEDVGLAEPASPRFWNVPNTLSMSRLVLALVMFGLIAYAHYLGALIVFLLAGITDALDGYLARLLNQCTAVGRQLDPMIDKVIVSGSFIYLLTVGGTGLAPWMVTTIVVRELLIQGLRSHLEGQGIAFGAKTAGKLKTVAQFLAIAAILLCLSLGHPSPPWLIARDVLNWLAVGLTIYSGLAYVALALPKLKS